MNFYRCIISIVTVCFLLTSCASKKKLLYFQGAENGKFTSEADYSPVFKVDDRIGITVSALDNNAAIPYNLPVVALDVSGVRANSSSQLQTYLVAKDGTIQFPQFGRIKVIGLTRLELIKLLEEKIGTKVKDPVVQVQLLNFKVTVLGEVGRKGTLPVSNERITILEAIGKAGDLTIYGVRENVLVIRETEKGKEFIRIDLTSPDLFDSEVYYLQQNDVVYVEPNKSKINSSTNSSTNGLIISGVSLLLTVISIMTRN